jgi:hypothetical protein
MDAGTITDQHVIVKGTVTSFDLNVTVNSPSGICGGFQNFTVAADIG